MDGLRIIAIIFLGGFGLYIIAANWAALWTGLVKKAHHSASPFLGAGLLASAILLTPVWSLWWIALIVDWGSAPWLLCSMGILLLRKIRKSSEK